MKNFEIKYTLIVFIIVLAAVYLITANTLNKENVPLYSDRDFYINILVEAHGMLLDAFLLGVLVVFFISKAEKRHEISQLHSEIGYIRLLKTDEAKFKIKALIEKLNHSKCYDLDLHQCTLQKIDLLGIKIINGKIHAASFVESNITNSNFSKSRGEKTYFIKSKMTNVQFVNTSFYRSLFIEADARNCNFKNSMLRKCKYEGANVSNCDFRNCDLSESTFENAKARSGDFRNANLKAVNFTNADLQSADFSGCINLTAEQIKRASNYTKIKVDIVLAQQLI